MAVQKDNQKAEEIQKESVLPESAQTAAPQPQTAEGQPEQSAGKKVGAGKYIFFLLIVVAAGLAGVPQTREFLLEKYRGVTAPSAEETQPEAVETAAENAVEPAEIAVRLEQLENERDFENAEVIVASVEKPEPPAAAAEDYTSLADQQKALLAEIERLRAQVDRLKNENSKQIEQLRASMPKTGLLEERLLAVSAREDAFEQQLVETGVKMERIERNKADASAVLSLMTRMEITEQKLRASNAEKERAAALLLAVYQLREAALSGQSFLAEQQSALALAAPMPRIAASLRSLSVAADQGVWTKTALLQSFASYADKAVLSETVSPKKDWFHQALNSLSTLVVIRRIDASDAEDFSTQAILARAQQAVDNGDLTVAVLQLQSLQGTAKEIMKDWTQAAQRYLTTQKTISETVSAVLGVIYANQAKGE
ncbi:MAG: COG4223 family protein [Alphaproteobacteria bacterium]